MAFVDSTNDIIGENQARMQAKQRLQAQLGQGLEQLGDMDRRAQEQARQDAIREEERVLRQEAIARENERYEYGKNLELAKAGFKPLAQGDIVGPPTPQQSGLNAVFEQVSNRSNEDRARAQKSQELDSRVKQAQYNESFGDFNQSREAEKMRLASDLQAKGRAQDLYKQDLKEAKDQKRLEIPGLGFALTPQDATKFKTSQQEAESAIGLIREIKELGTDINLTDISKRGILKGKLNALIGKMRIPLTGPGILTDAEFERIKGDLGDPSKVFSTEKMEKAKLDSLANMLIDAQVTSGRLAGLDDNALAKIKQGLSTGDQNTPPVNPLVERMSQMPKEQRDARKAELLQKYNASQMKTGQR
jgi:hypothetical protein